MVDMLDTNDLSLRRARLDIPFYAEEEAGSRNGALAESLGFLPDLTQIVECLQVGFEGSGPLTAAPVASTATVGVLRMEAPDNSRVSRSIDI